MGKSSKKEKHSHKESKSGKVKKHKDSKKHSHKHKTASTDFLAIKNEFPSQKQSTTTATNLPTKRSLASSTDLPKKKPKPMTTGYISDSTADEDKRSATKLAPINTKAEPIKKYISDSNSDSSDDDTKQPILRKEAPVRKAPPPEKKPAPAKKYTSDSDSDSTDSDTKRPVATNNKVVSIKKAPPPVKKPAPAKKYTSDSDSDSTDNDTKRPVATSNKTVSIGKEPPPVKKPALANKYTSDSDSDSTDNDTKRSVATSNQAVSIRKATPKQPASDSTDNNTRTWTTDPSQTIIRLGHYRTSELVNSDSDSDSDSNNHIGGNIRQPVFLERKQIKRSSKKGEYSNNRLQQHLAYRDRTQDPKTEYARRFVDEADKYNVHQDFFISDSESESDSGDDYTWDPPPWHTLVLNGSRLKKKTVEERWPLNKSKMTRKEDIILEKRIKKICRREGLSLEDLRGMLDKDFEAHKLFWRKIAKAFPDRPMNSIIRASRDRYNKFAYSNTPWTKEMDEQLIEYMKTDGTNYKVIENKMNRPRQELRQRAKELLQPEKKIVRKVVVFTDDQKQNLAQAVEANQNNGKIPWPAVAETFNKAYPDDQRNYHQCKVEWRRRNSGKEMIPAVKLSIIQAMKKHGWKREIDMNMALISDELGYDGTAIKKFYLKARTTIPEFEKKDLPDILGILERRFTEMVRSLED